MTSRSVAIASVAWILCAGCGALCLWRHDAGVALGHERWSGPLALALLHTPLAMASLRLGRAWLDLLFPASLGLGWLVLAGGAAPPPHAAGGLDGPDIVLVTLDTFRADHVGALGGPPGLTPHLDALARAAVVHRQAVTVAPLTAPAHASLWTGLGPRVHGLEGNSGRLDPAIPTVVEALRRRGYRTGAFLSAHVLDRATGLHRGFTHYDDRWGLGQRLAFLPGSGVLPVRTRSRRGDETVARALRWLRADAGAALLWVHLYDAHAPYLPPPDFAPSPAALAAARSRDDARPLPAELGAVEALARARPETRKAWYAASIRWTDALVGRLLAAVDDGAVVVVVADHGESLDEHGYWFNHGARLWEPSLRVPLMVRGIDPPGVDDALVAITHVAPLLLRAATGGPAGPRVDRVEAWTPGEELRRVEATSGLGRQPGAALRLDGAKIVAHGGQAPVYYDLVADPQELDPRPVPPGLEPVYAELEALTASPTPLDRRARERLRALGYGD